jgi:flagellar basal body-associated protein FliL
LAGEVGMSELRREILEKVNESFGEETVLDVYFTDFVVQ